MNGNQQAAGCFAKQATREVDAGHSQIGLAPFDEAYR